MTASVSIRLAGPLLDRVQAAADVSGRTVEHEALGMLAAATQWQCSCGRPFGTRSGRANHARKCPVEQARSAEFVRRIHDETTRTT